MPTAHGQQITVQIKHLDAVRAARDDAAVEGFTFAQGIFRQLALGDVFKDHCDPTLGYALDSEGVDFQSTTMGQPAFKSGGLTGAENCVKGEETILLFFRERLPNGLADYFAFAAMHGKCRVEFEITEVQRLACFVLRFLKDAKALINGIEYGAEASFAQAQLCVQRFHFDRNPHRVFHQAAGELCLFFSSIQGRHRLVGR